ncbi:penicillin acylase family protein [Dactylosporangium cerinum]
MWLAQRAGGERRGRPLGVCRQCGDSWRPAVHADDRLFQMDVTRRQTSGTLAELLGASAIPSDVQMHTIGLRRARRRAACRPSRRRSGTTCRRTRTASTPSRRGMRHPRSTRGRGRTDADDQHPAASCDG